MQRSLTLEEQNELNALNKAVDDAIKARTEWLDKKMLECSTLKPGDDIYDLNTGKKLGVVSELYRYWTRQNVLYDTSPGCHYRYQVPNQYTNLYFDNTSRHQIVVGTLDDVKQHLSARQKLFN